MMRCRIRRAISRTRTSRDPLDWNPEFSRRARGFASYAALRELGRNGLREMVQRNYDCAAAIVDGLRRVDGVEVLSEPIINQGLVSFRDPSGRISDEWNDAGHRGDRARRHLILLGNDLEKPARHAHQRLQLADIDERCAADGGRCGACVGKNARESASRLGMSPAIVEKDFWVCWILRLLFAEPSLKNQMVFKGGTSLSKVFGLIDRFSEDIDLALDWRRLGYDQEGVNDPYQITSSKTQQNRHSQEMNAKAVAYIRDTLLSQQNHLFASISGMIARIDEDDPHTVNVFYPAAFAAEYIRPAVRFEIGPLASWVPSSSHSIEAYAAQVFPDAYMPKAAFLRLISD